MASSVFFDGWPSILRTVVVGTLAYVAMILLLRASGKRTLSKMNAFDLIVTVSLGSTLASVLLSKSVALLDGIAAFTTLICLQYAVAWASVRSARLREITKAEPRMLAFEGEYLRSAMREERVTEGELLAALRQHGHSALDSVTAIVLETNGELSVVAGRGGSKAEALAALR